MHRSCTDRSHRPVPADATGDDVNDDMTTTGKNADDSADRPADSATQPLSETDAAEAPRDVLEAEVDRLRNEIKRENRAHRKLV